MNNFTKIKIGEIGLTITGKTPSSSNPEDFGKDYMFITPSDSFEDKMVYKTSRYLSEIGLNNLKNKVLPPKSILVSCIGSAMGKVLMNYSTAITNQQINSIIVNKKFNSDYIYYCLVNNYKLFRNAAAGSTALPMLNKTDFDELEITIHNDLKEQHKIASILSVIDSKIELNKKVNVELESMTKTLYDFWFVQFDFPDENGKPYKTSGGKMVWNQELKREIPNYWKISDLGNKIELFDSKRVPLSSQERSFKRGNIPYYGATGIMDYVDEHIFDGEFILLAEDGSVMDEKGFPIIQFIWGKTWVNNHAHVIKAADPIHNEFFFYHMKTIPVVLIKTGSIQMKINQENLKNYRVLIPDHDLITKFSIYATSIRKILKNNIDQNQQLTSLRDWLLPMLMNGQVKVD